MQTTQIKNWNFLEGEVLLIDKPLNWTSFDVVNKIRYAIKRHLNIKKIKVGHAGTLDPLATGLVLVCTGKNTKKINDFMGLDKVYTGTISLGGTTETYDLEGEIIPQSQPTFSLEEIQESATVFVGEIEQTPPIFSAKKIDGRKAYELARKGKHVEMKKSLVTVHKFNILNALPSKYIEGGLDCAFEVSCSKGTYIRSLAFDLGEKLGCGGFLSGLRRTKVGEFNIDNAISPEKFVELLGQ